jgi:endonuclease G, mitochondrial
MQLLKSRWSLVAIALISVCLLTGGFWWWNRNQTLNTTTIAKTEGHLALGNPSKASSRDENNYLITRRQYILSYNNTKRIPNWVSWKLTTSDIGSVPRQNTFTPDTSLPTGWFQVKTTDYAGSGYDRGHMCPAADRSANVEDNTATFILTNIIPQARDNNQGPWAKLEDYTRDQVKLGKEAYIVSGGYGQKGVLPKGKIAIPARTWKVIVFAEPGNKGAGSITEKTQVIAVDLPNEEGLKSESWKTYRTTIRDIESKTGYDFLNTVPQEIQDKLETQK